MSTRKALLTLIMVALTTAAPAFAGFSGTDVFLPSVGAKPGVAPAVWYTTVWVHNPNTTSANVTFYLLERQVNLAPKSYTDTVPAGDTKRYDNAVKTLFAVETFGAIRVTSNVKVLAGARIYSQSGTLDDSVGQYFAGLPAAFAIGNGQSTELTGVWQTQPAADSTFRYNFGFVETTGTGTCQVKVTVKDTTGAPLGDKSYTLRQWEQLQKGFKDEFPALSSDNARLTIEVTSGSGKVLAFGSSVANGSQDPATVEMAFRDELLGGGSGGLSEVTHDATLTGSGTTGSPLGLANGAVNKSKINATGGTDGQVLGTDGSTLRWQNPSTGSGSGDITGVTAGTGLAGGGTTGDVTLSIADNGITSPKIADGTVAAADLAAGAVTKDKLNASGGTNGQVLATDGAILKWQTPSGSASGDITGVTAGTGLFGGGTSGEVTLGLADEGVTTAKLAVGAVTQSRIFAGGAGAGKFLAFDGSHLVWQTPSGAGDITAVNVGAGMGGGGTSGDVIVGIAVGGVTSLLIADGTIGPGDVAFNYAASTSKGGSATDLACSGCVQTAELSGSGGASGKVLKHNGTSVGWGDDNTGAFTLPYAAPPQALTGVLFEINNTGAGAAAKLTANSGTALWVESSATYPGSAIRGVDMNTASNSGTGVIGGSLGGGIGVSGIGNGGIGVDGFAASGTGVHGDSNTGNGIVGEVGSGTGYGVKGIFGTTGSARWGYLGGPDAAAGGKVVSGSAPAVKAESSSGVALYATSSGVGGSAAAAVKAEQTASNGVAIYALNDSSSDATVILSNFGSGSIIKGYSYHGTVTPDLEFFVDGNGNVKADGAFSSPAADFAELLPAREGLEPGDVLAIDVDGKLMRSVEAYQASVVGVYSTKPGFIGGSAIGEDAQGQVPLAVVGVVPVKASAENGPIRPGDMLVASSTPGHAMRAGARSPNGCVIGKALGRLDSGTGSITIIVILQ